MDIRSKFSMSGVRQMSSDASTLFTRALQYTEEKLGSAEKTEYDANFENLLERYDRTKNWTEKLKTQTEISLQPNPNMRMEDFVYTKLDRRPPERATNQEILGATMIEAGNSFGPGTAYGKSLIKCGNTQMKLGESEKTLVHTSAVNFLKPLANFLEGDCKTIQKERKTLETKRLDLDACKNRAKKAKSLEARQSAENDLRLAQTDFDRQHEITKLLLEGLSSTHSHHFRSLNEFIEAQSQYHASCHQVMQELKAELNSLGDSPTAGAGSFNRALQPSAPVDVNDITARDANLPFIGSRKARVLYDYDANDTTELSLLADEVYDHIPEQNFTLNFLTPHSTSSDMG
ncbi:endophilin-B1-like isoform X2 [Styela clava]|uniref:endophilin-B1-like isoform X2 n=1 Tax=Styela clava TaxID=7725 RepID=UPI00193A3AE3|nr:endophilin-B1-like isoform X2 [Styela clava]